MLAHVEHVLDLADERVAEIEQIYEDTLRAQEVSGRLQALIRSTISDYRSALEFTANAVAKAHGVKGRSIYWPNAKSPTDFEEVFDKNLPGLREKHPEIAAAWESVQSYQRGVDWMGDLMALYRDNQHHGLTPQTRSESHAIRFQSGGASIQIGQGASIRMGAGADIRIGGRSIRDIEPERLVFVDWRFDETGKSALGTVKKIRDGIRQAVQEVSSAAGL